MDISIIIGSVVSFVKLLCLVSIIAFILYKVLSPLKQKLTERFSLSWAKSCLLFNFLSIFVFILAVYIYFMWGGLATTQVTDPDISFDLVDSFLLVLVAIPRILIASFILTLILFFFELVASFFSGKDSRKNQKIKDDWVSQFKGILVTSALFVALLLFVFSWVPLGLFVYIFYGSITTLPVLVLPLV